MSQGLASYTSSYWTPAPYYIATKHAFPVENNMGFLFDLPRRNPVSGPWYFGEGRENIPGTRELILRSDPEYFAVDGILPTINGKPMVDVNSAPYLFDRNDHTFRV